MPDKNAPVEIAGYRLRWILEKDDVRQRVWMRPISYINDDFSLDDIEPWSSDERADDCPF